MKSIKFAVPDTRPPARMIFSLVWARVPFNVVTVRASTEMELPAFHVPLFSRAFVVDVVQTFPLAFGAPALSGVKETALYPGFTMTMEMESADGEMNAEILSAVSAAVASVLTHPGFTKRAY